MRNYAGVISRVLLMCAASCLPVCSLAGQKKQVDRSILETENEVLKVEQARDQALQQRDVALLDEIYSDQLVFVNTRGQKFTKAQRLADLSAGKVEILFLQPGGLFLSSVRRHGGDDWTHQFCREIPGEGVNKIPRLFTNI
jgi:hypothetical protein